MARVQVGGGRKPKETAAARRAREAREAATAAAQDSGPARRGEEDDDLDEERREKALPVLDEAESPAALPHQATGPEPQPASSVGQPAVTLGRERAFAYTELPEDADPLEHVAHARRGIVNANQALTEGMGKLERNYVLSAGRYLWYATKDGRLKAAGFKSVEAFAEPLGLTRQDVYRLRRAVPVYLVIGDLVEEPLNERTIRELYQTLTNSNNELELTEAREADLRSQFAEMKRSGRVNSAGAIAARKLLMLGDPSKLIESEPEGNSSPPPVEQFTKARKANRLVDLATLKAVREVDPDAVKQYVDQLKEQYEAAARLLEGA